MADPATYSFYGSTIPTLRNLCTSAISTLTSAKNERASAESKFPSEQALLDIHFGTMYPLRQQPILFAKFSLVGLTHLSLTSAPIPTLEPNFTSLQDVIDYFSELDAVFAGVDEEKFNAAAEKSVDIPFQGLGKTLTMSEFADYVHGFMIPHDYFHVNAIYMLLRSVGFALGKPIYVGGFMSEQLRRDWAPLRG